jgi:uncharacterized protein (TIGR02145 family)
MIKYMLVLGLMLLGFGVKAQLDVDFVSINGKMWSKKNLTVTAFRNGDEIRNAATREEWIECLQHGFPAYCDYKNDTLHGKTYGRIYNWFAIADPRGLAPNGSRIANNSDWDELCLFASSGMPNWASYNTIGSALKSKEYWLNARPVRDTLYFNLLPGGYRNSNGEFGGLGNETAVWVRDAYTYGSRSKGNAYVAPYMLVQGKSDQILLLSDGRKTGCYVRLVLGEEYGLNTEQSDKKE